jgi:hypothetical protein
MRNPWLLSTFGPRYGSTAEGPDVANLAGLVSVTAGSALISWCLIVHLRLAPDAGVSRKLPTPAYLVREGPHHFSRNPTNPAEGMIFIFLI